MHPADFKQFDQIVHEYARWRAVPDDDRSPAPAWWWSPALAMIDCADPLTDAWGECLGLPAGSPVSTGARELLAALADQTQRPWPDEFPRKYRPKEPAMSGESP